MDMGKSNDGEYIGGKTVFGDMRDHAYKLWHGCGRIHARVGIGYGISPKHISKPWRLL